MTDRQFTKTVAIKAIDEDERTATGAVLVPNEVDRQRDFLRAEGVQAMFAEDPDDGVMHSAFPDGAAELVRNEVVDEPVDLNGETYPAGTWVATRQYNDDDLWQLVEDGVLSGFSIGGDISEVREYDTADVPDDVTFPDDVEPGPATEIVDGSVEEVSDVDIPAVPRAVYRELGKLGKAITEEVDGEAEFVEVMQGRGHSESDARELWSYLQEHSEKSASETEKPIVLPNGAEFEDFETCVDSVAGDDTTEEEARQVCGAGRERNKVDVNGTEVDLTPPTSMVNAAQAALDAKERLADEIGDCGSGRGEQRAQQIVNGTLSPADFVSDENGTPIPAYLNSHAADAPDTDATPPNWSDETWTDGCGPVQLALWGGTGGGEPREWAMRRANELARAMEDQEPYDEVKSMTEKQEYSVDDWVSWEASGGRAMGQIVEIREDGTFDDAISGDVSVEGTEDDPAYLIEVWQGRGDDASAIEEESGRGDTLHVAHRESTVREVGDPREAEASKSGILASLKSLFGTSQEADDGSLSEDSGADAEKQGRTLSQQNRRAVMASIDAQLDMLDDAGVEHGMERFTDRAAFAFDIEEYGSAEQAASQHGDGEEMGKTNTETDMTDDNTESEKSADAPEWAESLTEKVESIEKRVNEMEEGDDAEKSLDDAPEWAQDLAEKVGNLDERVETVSKATADTQQTGGQETTGTGSEDLSKTEKQKRELFFGDGGN